MLEDQFISPIQNQALGFASPAETEREAPLDLNRQLIAHPAATFFLRAQSAWPEFGICVDDVLVVDRAWEISGGLLALGIQDGKFCLGRLHKQAGIWRLGSQSAKIKTEIWGIVCHVIRQLV